MKIIFTTFLLIFLTFGCQAGNGFTETQGKLSSGGTGKARFYRLVELSSMYYQSGNSDSMLPFAQELLKTAQVLKNDSFIVAAYKILGNCSRLKSDYITAIQYYFIAVQQAQKYDHIPGLLCILYNNIGDNYNKLGYYTEALKYLKKAAGILKVNSLISQKHAAYIYTNIAETFLWMDKPDSALHYLQLAYNANLVAMDIYIRAAIYLGYGMALEKSADNHDMAEFYYRRAIFISDSMNDNKHIANSYYEYGNFLYREGKYEASKHSAIHSFKISVLYNYKDNIIDNSDLLSHIYDKQKQNDSAYFYSVLKVAYSDSVFNLQKRNQLLSMTFNEQIREKEEETKKLELAHQRTRNIQYSLIAIALVSFIILFLILSQSIIVNGRTIVFLGELALLISFEFINLLLHPYIEEVAHESPFIILALLVVIASILIPIHHRLDKLVSLRLVEKNKRIKIKAAKRILEELGE